MFKNVMIYNLFQVNYVNDTSIYMKFGKKYQIVI